MEKKLFIIYHNNFVNSDSFDKFKENISSNFMSKVISPNLTIVVSSIHGIAYNVFNSVTANIPEEEFLQLGIFVMAFDDYYGALDTDVWDWIEEKTEEKLTRK